MVPQPPNSRHIHPKFPVCLIYKFDKMRQLVAAKNKILCYATEALTQDLSYLGEASILFFGVYRCLELLIGSFKPLEEGLDVVWGALLSFVWSVSHLDVVELKGARGRHFPS